jgi:simple sugar transport system ATP-binding protein
VGTVNTADVTREELARMMVGRDVVFRVDKETLERGEAILKIHDLHALNDRRQTALNGVSFDVCQREILGLAGVSGNGQKELFEVLMGARKPLKGQAWIEGKELTNLSPQQIARAGLVNIPEDRIEEGLVPDFTVEENLILGRQKEKKFARRSFLLFRNIRSFAEECIRSFEIATPTSLQKTKNLSGGNLQKVILARELTQEPRCILANQPTRGLDVGATEYVHRRLLEQRSSGAGILLISEDLDELFNLSDRIAVLYRGEIVGLFITQQTSLEQVGMLMAGVRGDG